MFFFQFHSASKLFIQPAHIYAISDAICQYPANFGHMSLKNVTLDKQCFIKTRKGFMALAYDGDQRTLFYSENSTKSISKVQLRRGEYTETIVKAIGVVKGTEKVGNITDVLYLSNISWVLFWFTCIVTEIWILWVWCLIEGSRCLSIMIFIYVIH